MQKRPTSSIQNKYNALFQNLWIILVKVATLPFLKRYINMLTSQQAIKKKDRLNNTILRLSPGNAINENHTGKSSIRCAEYEQRRFCDTPASLKEKLVRLTYSTFLKNNKGNRTRTRKGGFEDRYFTLNYAPNKGNRTRTRKGGFGDRYFTLNYAPNKYLRIGSGSWN